jgi:hypothetical protein
LSKSAHGIRRPTPQVEQWQCHGPTHVRDVL